MERVGSGRLGAAVALSLTLGAALTLAAAATVELAGQTEAGQWAVFVTTFAVALPVSALAGWALLGRDNGGTDLRAVAAIAAVGLVLLLGAARLASAHGVSGRKLPAAELAALLVLATIVLAALGRRFRPPGLGRLGSASWSAMTAAAVLAGVIALFFAPSGVSAGSVALALLAAATAVAAGRLGVPRPAGGWGAAADLLVAVLIVMAVVDVVGLWPPGPEQSSGYGLIPPAVAPVVQIHQNFYLGSVNDVLHGRAMLVDAGTLYGVGPTYLMAAWFKLAPLGYGALGLLGGLATAAQCLLAWGALRVARVGRLLAAGALLAAVFATVLAPLGSPAYFINVGGLRFLLPYLLLLCAVLAARRGRAPISPAVLVTLAACSVWSVEMLAYGVAAYAGVVLFESALGASDLRDGLGQALRSAAKGLAACVAAHLLFALLTLAFSGGLPDWGWYIDYFRQWSTYLGGLVAAWSPAWIVGGAYFASLLGVAALLAARRTFAKARRVELLAISATSTLGVGTLSYFLSHASDLYLPFVAMPALMVGCLWLSLALAAQPLPEPARSAAVGLAGFVLALVLLASWSHVERRWPRTALAHLLPGGRSLRADLDRSWDSPPLDRRAPAAVRLIDRYLPPGKALVLVEPDLGTEALIRSGRANLLPISYPWQDQAAPERTLSRVRGVVAGLMPGTPLLLQRWSAPPTARKPSPALTVEWAWGGVKPGHLLSPIQLDALRMIRSRFALRPVAPGPDGLIVVRLARPAHP